MKVIVLLEPAAEMKLGNIHLPSVDPPAVKRAWEQPAMDGTARDEMRKPKINERRKQWRVFGGGQTNSLIPTCSSSCSVSATDREMGTRRTQLSEKGVSPMKFSIKFKNKLGNWEILQQKSVNF